MDSLAFFADLWHWCFQWVRKNRDQFRMGCAWMNLFPFAFVSCMTRCCMVFKRFARISLGCIDLNCFVIDLICFCMLANGLLIDKVSLGITCI